jgi:hypothetical protein
MGMVFKNIEYMNGGCFENFQDVRFKRGADVALDHFLQVARLRLKLKKNHMDRKDTFRKRDGTNSLQKLKKNQNHLKQVPRFTRRG